VCVNVLAPCSSHGAPQHPFCELRGGRPESQGEGGSEGVAARLCVELERLAVAILRALGSALLLGRRAGLLHQARLVNRLHMAARVGVPRESASSVPDEFEAAHHTRIILRRRRRARRRRGRQVRAEVQVVGRIEIAEPQAYARLAVALPRTGRPHDALAKRQPR